MCISTAPHASGVAYVCTMQYKGQRDPEFSSVHSREDVARATGLELDDLASDVPIQTVSTGVAFTIVPIKKLETMQRLRLDTANAAAYL